MLLARESTSTVFHVQALTDTGSRFFFFFLSRGKKTQSIQVSRSWAMDAQAVGGFKGNSSLYRERRMASLHYRSYLSNPCVET